MCFSFCSSLAGWKVWFLGGMEVEKTEVREVKTRRKTTKQEEEAIWLECFGEVVCCFTVMIWWFVSIEVVPLCDEGKKKNKKITQKSSFLSVFLSPLSLSPLYPYKIEIAILTKTQTLVLFSSSLPHHSQHTI